MLNLKVDPFNTCAADDEHLAAHVISTDDRATAYIVKAVNHHEALVRVLRAITDDYIELGDSGDAGFWEPREKPPIKAALDLLASLE